MASFKLTVPDDELLAWKAAAEALGMTLAAYIRARVSGRIAIPAPTLASPSPAKRRSRSAK